MGDMGGPGWLPGLAGADARGNGEWLLLLCCFSCLIWVPGQGWCLIILYLLYPILYLLWHSVGECCKFLKGYWPKDKKTHSPSLYTIRVLEAPGKSWQSWIKGAPPYSLSLSVCILVLQGAGRSPEPCINEAPHHPPSLSETCCKVSDS